VKYSTASDKKMTIILGIVQLCWGPKGNANLSVPHCKAGEAKMRFENCILRNGPGDNVHVCVVRKAVKGIR
jgi:hypothetical protein